MKKGSFRRAGFGVLATLTAFAGLVPLASSSSAVAGFAFTRLAGADRYATARTIAESTFVNSDNVVLATGENFADALSGNFLAGEFGAPILLTTSATLHPQARTALATIRAKNVIILGGTAAISAAVEADLRATTSTATGGGLLGVTRIGGADRYETSRLVSTAPGTDVDPVTSTGRRTAFVATGDVFADALAAGPASYARGIPVILTEGGPATTLNANARQALDDLNIQTAQILGGPAAITNDTLTAVGAANQNPAPGAAILTARIQGVDRTETARAVANYSIAALGFTASHVNLATGSGWADALAGAAHGGKEASPLLLTVSATQLSNDDTGARRFLLDNASTLTSGHIFGGFDAIGAAVESEATVLAGGPPPSATSPINLTSTTTVAQGGTVSGTVSSSLTVASLSVSGCGMGNTNLAVGAPNASGAGAFAFAIPFSQAAGTCTLSFVVQRTNGVSQTQNIVLTITVVPVVNTNAPDLLSASFGTDNTVVYVFDEPPVGIFPFFFTAFHVYRNDGVQITPSVAPLANIVGNTVVARYGAGQLTAVTTAAVERAAVQDAGGLPNPEGAVPIQNIDQASGFTAAPDLLSVGNFATLAAPAGALTADFVFDQAVAGGFGAAPTDPVGVAPAPDGAGALGFQLVRSDGTTFFGIPGTATIVTADSRTVRVQFTGGPGGIAISQLTRGTVEAATVTSGAVANAMQAADIQAGGITDAPDVNTAVVTGTNTITVTFDEPVNPFPFAFNFRAYNAGGVQTVATTATRSATNAAEVELTFPAGIVGAAVGLNVQSGGVSSTTGALLPNANDEVGLQNVSFVAGRTSKADLVSVRITLDSFGNAVVTYTFDQAIALGYSAPVGDFKLFDAQAFQLLPTGPGVFGGGRTTVTFSVANGNPFSNANATAAVVGGVNHAAADGTFAPFPFSADEVFPEGSAPITR